MALHVKVIQILILTFVCISAPIQVNGKLPRPGFSTWLFGTDTYNIHIYNKLPRGSPPLQIKCRSRDDDLGAHQLNRDDQLEWGVKVNILQTTKFWCDAFWNHKHKGWISFFALWEEKCQAQICYWFVKEDGIYFSGATGSPTPGWEFTWRKEHEWDPIRRY